MANVLGKRIRNGAGEARQRSRLSRHEDVVAGEIEVPNSIDRRINRLAKVTNVLKQRREKIAAINGRVARSETTEPPTANEELSGTVVSGGQRVVPVEVRRHDDAASG